MAEVTEVHRLTQLLGGDGIGVRKRLFIHLPNDKEKMKTHVTLPGASGRMDAQVVDIEDVEREIQADMPPLEPLDMNMVRRAKTILFSTAQKLAHGNRRRAAPRWSAPAELFLTCASPSYLKAWVWKKSRKQQRNTHARSRSWFPFWYTRNEHSIHLAEHTTQTAP